MTPGSRIRHKVRGTLGTFQWLTHAGRCVVIWDGSPRATTAARADIEKIPQVPKSLAPRGPKPAVTMADLTEAQQRHAKNVGLDAADYLAALYEDCE